MYIIKIKKEEGIQQKHQMNLEQKATVTRTVTDSGQCWRQCCISPPRFLGDRGFSAQLDCVNDFPNSNSVAFLAVLAGSKIFIYCHLLQSSSYVGFLPHNSPEFALWCLMLKSSMYRVSGWGSCSISSLSPSLPWDAGVIHESRVQKVNMVTLTALPLLYMHHKFVKKIRRHTQAGKELVNPIPLKSTSPFWKASLSLSILPKAKFSISLTLVWMLLLCQFISSLSEQTKPIEIQ